MNVEGLLCQYGLIHWGKLVSLVFVSSLSPLRSLLPHLPDPGPYYSGCPLPLAPPIITSLLPSPQTWPLDLHSPPINCYLDCLPLLWAPLLNELRSQWLLFRNYWKNYWTIFYNWTRELLGEIFLEELQAVWLRGKEGTNLNPWNDTAWVTMEGRKSL